MYWAGVLFSYWGRIGRRTFWAGSAGLFAFLLVYQYLTGGLVLEIAGWMVWNYVQSALTVKRLHDVGWTGWWAAVPSVAVLAGAFALNLVNRNEGSQSVLRVIGLTIPMACAIGYILGFGAWIGTRPGETHDNRFGEPPHDQEVAD